MNALAPYKRLTIKIGSALLVDKQGKLRAAWLADLAAVSAAKPKIADYPFTTLHPNLGVVSIGERDFVLADIPGLIEGASEGAGIGDRFLGHVERCGVLIHLIDGTQDDVKLAYKTIRTELAAYDERLAEKPELVVLNKIDAIEPDDLKEKVKALTSRFPIYQ